MTIVSSSYPDSSVSHPGLVPASDSDPFSRAVIEDPSALHAELRDAGPIVYLTRYDTYALARYEDVHAALTNWQQFPSGYGVGLSPGGEVGLDAVPALAEAFPLRVFPDAVGLRQAGREHLLPYGDHAFNAFGPGNDLVARGALRVAELSAWVGAQSCTASGPCSGRWRSTRASGVCSKPSRSWRGPRSTRRSGWSRRSRRSSAPPTATCRSVAP